MTNILDTVEPDAMLESNGHPKHKSSIQSSEERRLWGERQPLYSRSTLEPAIERLLAEHRKQVLLEASEHFDDIGVTLISGDKAADELRSMAKGKK